MSKFVNNSCGDDYKTRTKFITEKNPGNALKLVLLVIYDLIFKWNLSKSEVKLLLCNLVDEHIEETSEGGLAIAVNMADC